MTSEPLFPLPPGLHRTYVTCVDLPWPHTGVGLRAVCRTCDWRGESLRAFYDSAHEDALRHSRLMDEEAGKPWWGTYGPY